VFPVAQVFNLCLSIASLRAAHAPSPDVRVGHPARRSLDAGSALGILPSLAGNAGSRSTGSPSLNGAP